MKKPDAFGVDFIVAREQHGNNIHDQCRDNISGNKYQTHDHPACFHRNNPGKLQLQLKQNEQIQRCDQQRVKRPGYKYGKAVFHHPIVRYNSFLNLATGI